MITYVNTVLVSNKNGNSLASSSDLEGKDNKDALKELVGKFVFMNCDPAMQDGSPMADVADVYVPNADVDTFKIGVIKDSYYTKFDKAQGKTLYIPTVKWSNEIKVADIKSLSILRYMEDTEDKVIVDFSNIVAPEPGNETNRPEASDLIYSGGIPIVLRLTFKDTPTRYRKWSESYDYVTKPGDTGVEIAAGLAETISRQIRRARVYASVDGAKLILEAMPYDDDNTNETFNVANKVRFNANCWFSDPGAPGFASNNKYAIGEITKEAGVQYPASAKLVRDRERDAQGYEGLMHRCCWYDPKPAIVANISNKYGGITLEFENMYRAADDIFRKTKQTVEIYASNNGDAMSPGDIADGLVNVINQMIANRQKCVAKIDNSKAYNPENYQA